MFGVLIINRANSRCLSMLEEGVALAMFAGWTSNDGAAPRASIFEEGAGLDFGAKLRKVRIAFIIPRTRPCRQIQIYVERLGVKRESSRCSAMLETLHMCFGMDLTLRSIETLEHV